jgi:Flp pilus assembly protein TadB
MNRARFGLVVAGFVLALLSVALDDHRLAWGAIALLTASLIIRLVLRKREKPKSGGDAGL